MAPRWLSCFHSFLNIISHRLLMWFKYWWRSSRPPVPRLQLSSYSKCLAFYSALTPRLNSTKCRKQQWSSWKCKGERFAFFQMILLIHMQQPLWRVGPRSGLKSEEHLQEGMRSMMGNNKQGRRSPSLRGEPQRSLLFRIHYRPRPCLRNKDVVQQLGKKPHSISPPQTMLTI